MRTIGWLSLCCLALSSAGFAGDGAPLVLPAPEIHSGKPLMQALKERRTSRELTPGPVSLQELGNLLWAAFGINRPDTGGRTAPSAMNSQEIELYVALTNGVYLYQPREHQLAPVVQGDLRGSISSQAFVKNAALVLVYVARLDRLAKARPESRPFYAAIDAGCIIQNVYLFCASENLGTVVFDLERKTPATLLGLGADQEIILAQAVGGLPQAQNSGARSRDPETPAPSPGR